MNKAAEERQWIVHFLKQTEKRIEELEEKSRLTKAETYELDMCKYDVRRARKELDGPAKRDTTGVNGAVIRGIGHGVGKT